MEDIEDMVGEFAGAPLGLHLPKKEDSSPPRRNGSNAVVIKPRRQQANSGGSSVVSTCVDGTTETAKAKVPGTQVRVPAGGILYLETAILF